MWVGKGCESHSKIRPPLSKKLFPVGRVGTKTASWEVGIFFFFPNFNFLKLECTGGKVKKFFFEKMKKKVTVGPFRPTRPVHRKQLFI